MIVFNVIRRAFSSNLRTISLTDSERSRFEARGISEPVAQRYLAWRKAMMLIVILATVISAGLTTYTDLTDTGEEPNVLESLTDQLMEGVDKTLPDTASAALELVKEKAGKAGEAAATEEDEPEPNAFEKFTDIVQSAALYTLAAAALLAFVFRNRPKLSFRILATGFLFGFFVPIAIALCPWSWFGYVEKNVSPLKDPTAFLKDTAQDALEAMKMLAMLLPAVLALVPGVLKGCLRVKTLLPASMLPGWFIAMAAPLYGLFLLAVFVAINQVTSDPLLIGGVLLLVAAHLLYAFKSQAFTQPLITDADFARMKNAQRIVGLITLAAAGLVVTYLSTRKFMGAHIVGTSPKDAFLTPIDLVGYGVEIISRSMFVGVLSVDLFMRINLAAWNDIKRLAQSESGISYQNTMDAMDEVLK